MERRRLISSEFPFAEIRLFERLPWLAVYYNLGSGLSLVSQSISHTESPYHGKVGNLKGAILSNMLNKLLLTTMI